MRNLAIKRILIPTDFSETANLALEHAVKMARLLDSEITLLHVVSTFAFRVNLPEMEFGSKLNKIAEEISQKEGLKVSTLITSGRIREEVVRVAEEIYADIIILGTHGVSGLREFFMGSNAFRIVSDAACPVLCIQESGHPVGFKNIIVPIDNSFYSREKLGLSIKLARLYDATIHICGLRSHDHNDEEINAKFRIKMKQVDDFLHEQDVEFTSTTLYCENIATASMEYAAEIKADLIIIMNEQEVNSTGFFMGPYAQQVVNHSKIPVISIRPTSSNVEFVNPF